MIDHNDVDRIIAANYEIYEELRAEQFDAVGSYIEPSEFIPRPAPQPAHYFPVAPAEKQTLEEFYELHSRKDGLYILAVVVANFIFLGAVVSVVRWIFF